jgi:hypothetical protein
MVFEKNIFAPHPKQYRRRAFNMYSAHEKRAAAKATAL